MFRYIIALLLVNTYYSSLGLGIPVNNNASVPVLLSTLEKSCGSSFLSTQIRSKIKECLVVPENEIQRIKCLMFYDINSQLCEAVGASKLAFKDDYTLKFNEFQDVTILCNEAKDWVFPNITAFSHYKSIIENVFKHQGTCGQVCGTNDLTGNSNYYCIYYKWGLDKLKSLVTTSTTTTTTTITSQVSVSDVVAGQNPSDTAANNDNKANAATNNKDMLDLKINQDSSSADVKVKETSSKATLKVDDTISAAQVPPEATGLSSSTNQQLVSVGENKGDKTVSNIDKPEAPIEGEVNVNQDESNKPQSGHSYVPYVPEADKDKDPVLDQPNTKEQGDTGLGSDGLDDLHYDDADDADVKPEEEKVKDSIAAGSNTGNKLPVDEIDSLGSANGGYYGSTNQDGYSDDDDHFFTFFLITVVMVVLLYVLYHNKNKVSKIFFGLMLEGRQSGRRRNSRGHAYRRLDTLEQAMSGNTAAPPSKIIY